MTENFFLFQRQQRSASKEILLIKMRREPIVKNDPRLVHEIVINFYLLILYLSIS